MEDKKKVFHFLNTGNYSGAENVVVNIATLLGDYHHIYVSPDGPINEILIENNIDHISISKLSFISYLHIVNKYKPDIIHAHDFKASIIAGILANSVKRYGGKIISQLHKNDVRMTHISIVSILFCLLLNQFSKIIVVSQSVIDEYIFSSKLKKKAVVINNIVNYEKIKRDSLKFDIDNYDIVYVARMSDEKGPLKFIDIIERVNQRNPIKVIWVGDGNMLDIVKHEIEFKHLESVIKLVGFQTNPYPYIRAGKIAVMTSKYEGFGLSALEAQLLGKPVVSTNVGGLNAILTSSTGLLTNDDSEFIDEIIRLLNDDEYYLFKQKHAKERSNKINNISGYIRKLNFIYRES